MTREQISHALEYLNRELASKYGERAAFSMIANHYLLIEKQEDGGSNTFSSDKPHDVVSRIVDDTKTIQKEFSQAEAIYREYPRKRDVGAARKAIRRALRDTEIPVVAEQRFIYLQAATRLFALWTQENKTEKDYVPYPATWFNRKSYLNAPDSVFKMMQSIGVKPVIAKKRR